MSVFIHIIFSIYMLIFMIKTSFFVKDQAILGACPVSLVSYLNRPLPDCSPPESGQNASLFHAAQAICLFASVVCEEGQKAIFVAPFRHRKELRRCDCP